MLTLEVNSGQRKVTSKLFSQSIIIPNLNSPVSPENSPPLHKPSVQHNCQCDLQ